MTTFTQLVEARASNQPASYYARGQEPGQANPLMGKNPSSDPAQAPSSDQPRQDAPAPAQGYNGTANARQLPAKWAQERAETEALKQKVDNIRLQLVMSVLGASGNQDNDKSKWKIPNGENVTVTGQKWYNLQAEVGKIGAVNLVMHVMGLKYPLAVRWLAKQFDETIDSDDIKAAAETVSEKKFFTPPGKSDRNIAFVKHYLRMVRRIPEKIIEDLIAQGRIYADDERNCVFASEGIAELRSTHDGPKSVKKLVPGSSRKQGFIVLPEPEKNERTLAICESSIDAMSYRALNPGRAAISSAGANRKFPRAVAEDAVANGFKVIAAFDADGAGDKASQALFNHFYLKLWLKHKGQAELGLAFTQEDLFGLLDSNTVWCNLSTQPGSGNSDSDEESFDEAQGGSNASIDADAASGANLLFFNKANPFEDPNFKPMIHVSIKRNQFGLPVCESFPIEVSQKGYDFVVNQIGVTRDRPRGEKDWNEILKRMDVKPSTSTAKPA